MIRYRCMEREDCQAVQTLFEECFSHPWKKEAIEESLGTEGYVSLVAESDQRVVGYIGYRSVLDEADITNVAVSPELRRQGIGRQLMGRLLSLAGEKGILTIFLEVRVSNTAAITLYEHAGFHTCGQRKNYYTEPVEDALLMSYSK